MENPIPRKFFLFTYPRTASNLLIKILSPENQPSLLKSKFEYFFAPTLAWKLGPAQLGGKPFSAWSEDQKTGLRQSFTECAQTLADVCKKAEEEGKDIYIKEHVNWLLDPVAESVWAFGNTGMGTDNTPWTIGANILPGESQTHSPGNETIFSDEFLMSWRPTFLIRHPALVFPSLYRTIFDTEGAEAAQSEAYHVIEMTMHWSRALYDWYAAQSSISSPWPIILEADDLMGEPTIVQRYSQVLGFDLHRLAFKWAPADEEELKKMGSVDRRMKSTIAASGGIVGGKTAEGLDIDTEFLKWRGEFGEVEARKIENWVKMALPDYDYMKERRLRV